MKTKQILLPPYACDFLRIHPGERYWAVVRAFHHWMAKRKLDFDSLDKTLIQKFIRKPRGKKNAPETQTQYKRRLVRYLKWLKGKKLCHLDLKFLLKKNTNTQKRPKAPIPKITQRYICTLSLTRKNSTLSRHRSALRKFHQWLVENRFPLETLKRKHTERFLLHLKDTGLLPVSINGYVAIVRLYLRWLHAQDIVKNHPDDLLRASDWVKVPKYLPKPLPPAADKELQERLALSSDVHLLGLLLMRLTGLRLGELCSLEKNCVQKDHLGNHFLKVPLGKLNSERLVPLDDETIALIHKITELQGHCKTFLIETKWEDKTAHGTYYYKFKKIRLKSHTAGPLHPHRLRHTYATTLLNAGMSLVGVMKLLGHNDIRMTLRYAEVSQQSISKEYFKALKRLEHRYSDTLNNQHCICQPEPPDKTLQHLILLIKKHCADNKIDNTETKALIKRIQRIQSDVQKLLPIP